MSFIKDNQRGIISYQIRQLPCRTRGARSHNPAWTVLYIETFFFFMLIGRLVCTIQSNQTLDALNKYVAFHILSSGQLEILLSVYSIR